MTEIRWIRVGIAIAIGFVIYLAASYIYIQSQATSITLEGCAINFRPDGSSEIIKNGDVRCPK